MSVQTIAIQSPGDMGHGVGRDLIERGYRVVTCLAGRSERSRKLAAAGGLELLDSINALVQEADLVLSIVPPAVAGAVAETFSRAMHEEARFVPFADCNAVAPQTVQGISEKFSDVPFIDAGIIGLAPGKSPLPTRFYCSGADTSALEALDGGGISVRRIGPEIGQASAMKMVYASVTKGTGALHAAALTLAARFDLYTAYEKEMLESQPAVWQAMNRLVPRLPLDAERFIGEMHEIAATYESVGLPPGFHEGAAAMYEILTRTPIAAETRETVDTSRTLDQALATYVAALEP